MGKGMSYGKKRSGTVSVGRIETALFAAAGIQAAAAEALKMTRSNICRRIAESPRLQQAVVDARENALDVAESQLMKLITEGDGPSIRYFLDCHGKSRGYGRRGLQVEVDGPIGATGVLVIPAQVETYEEWLEQEPKELPPFDIDKLLAVDAEVVSSNGSNGSNGKTGGNGNGRKRS